MFLIFFLSQWEEWQKEHHSPQEWYKRILLPAMGKKKNILIKNLEIDM